MCPGWHTRDCSAECLSDDWREHRNCKPVNVIDEGCEKDQTDYQPPQVRYLHCLCDRACSSLPFEVFLYDLCLIRIW